MKCGYCEKEISRLRRLLSPLIGKKTYRLCEESEGSEDCYPLCETCGKFWEIVANLVSTYGEDKALEIIESYFKEG